MDLKAYISSGIIENYVLGLTSIEENREVEQMQKQYPEVAEAVKSYETDLEEFASLHAVKPPVELKAKVMGSLKQQILPEETVAPSSKAIVRRLHLWKRIAVVAVILFLISAGFNIFIFPKYQQYKEDYRELATNNERILAKNKVIEASLEKLQGNLHMLMNPDIQPVVMEGTKKHPGLAATVYWNKKNRQTYLGKIDLPIPPSGKTYQLWAIVNGKPVSLGLYNPKKQKDNLPKTMEMVAKGKVQAFAITLEKSGGSPTPTMDQMVVLGATS